MNRREFLRLIGASTALSAAGCKWPLGGGRPVALQLWSINKIMWKTMPPEEVFAKLREIGFDGVEFAGFGGRSAKEIRKLLKDAGLRGMGAHMSGIGNFSGLLSDGRMAECSGTFAMARRTRGEDSGGVTDVGPCWSRI